MVEIVALGSVDGLAIPAEDTHGVLASLHDVQIKRHAEEVVKFWLKYVSSVALALINV